MKYGIIFCLYNCESTVELCLNAWKQVKDERFVYSAVSAPFKGYEDFNPPKDNTIELARAANIMDKHFISNTYLAETEARGLCLEYLKEQNCDIVIQVDGDELFSIEQIKDIIKYIESRPDCAWFKLSLKNYVFDDKTYLEEPFTPMRVFRVKFPPFQLGKFRDDNNCFYNPLGGGSPDWPDESLKGKIIPYQIKHLTWINGNQSMEKIKYQNFRWSNDKSDLLHGDGCSFKSDNFGNLSFSEKFYRKNNKAFPKLLSDINPS